MNYKTGKPMPVGRKNGVMHFLLSDLYINKAGFRWSVLEKGKAQTSYSLSLFIRQRPNLYFEGETPVIRTKLR